MMELPLGLQFAAGVVATLAEFVGAGGGGDGSPMTLLVSVVFQVLLQRRCSAVAAGLGVPSLR